MEIAKNLSTKELESQFNLAISNRDEKIVHLNQELVERDHRINFLEEQLAWFKRQIFGKRSERVVSSLNNEQLLFEGFENLPASEEKQKKKIPTHERRKPNRDGQDKIALSPDLPVQTIILDVPEEQKISQETGKPLVQIGVEITHKLAHRPGTYYIKEIIRHKYANPHKEDAGILAAELPESLLPKCRADESLLAEIIIKKFAEHLPLYRIAESMEREGVRISRKLLSQWVIRTGMALKPLYDEMQSRILSSQNIYIDETPVKLQEAVKCKQAYMWVIVGGNESNPAYRVYDFREDRCHDNVLDILKDYRGVLHSDKYGAYQKLAERKIITWCPCWSHIRRKFFDAETGDPAFRQWVLRKIRYLFSLERAAWARSPEERLRIRQEKEVPIIDELIERIKSKLLDGKILPKSKLREALGYFCGLIPYLKNYTNHAFSKMDNNVAERGVRPLAIGRKTGFSSAVPMQGKPEAFFFHWYKLVEVLASIRESTWKMFSAD